MLVWRFISALSFLFLLAWGGSVSGAPAVNGAAPSADSVVITSQSLVFKNQENIAVFDGKVVMTKAGFIMHADHMVAYFAGASETESPTTKKATKSATAAPRVATPELPTLGSRAVSLIEATGNVIMEQGHKKAKSKKAVYSQHDEKLVLTGDPEAWEQGYHVTGTKMTMFLKEDRSIVETSRVVISDATTGAR